MYKQCDQHDDFEALVHGDAEMFERIARFAWQML